MLRYFRFCGLCKFVLWADEYRLEGAVKDGRELGERIDWELTVEHDRVEHDRRVMASGSVRLLRAVGQVYAECVRLRVACLRRPSCLE